MKEEGIIYEAPSVNVLEVKTEGFVCQGPTSLDDPNDYVPGDNPFGA